MGYQVVTANRLDDGRVVFLDSKDGWVASVADADALPVEDSENLLARAKTPAQAAVVVGPYLIDVIRNDAGAWAPSRYREVIRTKGPSCTPEHGYQAAQASQKARQEHV